MGNCCSRINSIVNFLDISPNDLRKISPDELKTRAKARFRKLKPSEIAQVTCCTKFKNIWKRLEIQTVLIRACFVTPSHPLIEVQRGWWIKLSPTEKYHKTEDKSALFFDRLTICSSCIVVEVCPAMLVGLFFLGIRLFGIFLTIVPLCENPCLLKAKATNSSVGNLTSFTRRFPTT